MEEAVQRLNSRGAIPSYSCYRQSSCWFQPSKFLGEVKETLFRERKCRDLDKFSSVKTEFQTPSNMRSTRDKISAKPAEGGINYCSTYWES